MVRTTADDEELDHSKFWPQLPKRWVAQRKNQFRPFYFTDDSAQMYFTHYSPQPPILVSKLYIDFPLLQKDTVVYTKQ